jgi:hypothetical protein
MVEFIFLALFPGISFSMGGSDLMPWRVWMKYFDWLQSEQLIGLIIGHPQQKNAWLQRVWLMFLFIGGLFLWGQLLNWGRGPLDFHDWADIFGPRLAVLRAAILNGVLPLHTFTPVIEDGVTLRYLAIPDQILSPQIFLLPWINIGQFILFQFWLMYALGFWALLQLRCRFMLSLFAFTILFALFNFNGHILSHASVGHANWGGYFLYPVFALLIFDLLDGKANWRWVAKVVFLSLFIFLQGSYHHFIWMLFFLGLLALAVPRRFWWLTAAAVFAVLVSMVRILPAILLLGEVNNKYVAGYPLVLSIWQYMTQLQTPYDYTLSFGLTNSIGTWEYTFYVGILGALFILYFGAVRPLLSRDGSDVFRPLLLPCLGLTILSMDKVYSTLRQVFPLPLFTGERVAARIFSLAFVFLLIGAAVHFQRWLDGKHLSLGSVVGMLGLVVLGANDLQRNLFMWSVLNVAKYYPVEYFLPGLYYPANQLGDTKYLTLLSVGLIISLVSAIGLLFLAWREWHMASR